MKINYETYLSRRPMETDPARLARMERSLRTALPSLCSRQYETRFYADGVIMVKERGEFAGCFNANTGRWFSGAVGDYS